jgi:hypothetical protein
VALKHVRDGWLNDVVSACCAHSLPCIAHPRFLDIVSSMCDRESRALQWSMLYYFRITSRGCGVLTRWAVPAYICSYWCGVRISVERTYESKVRREVVNVGMSLALCYTCLRILFWAALRHHDVDEVRGRVKCERIKVTSTSWHEDDKIVYVEGMARDVPINGC